MRRRKYFRDSSSLEVKTLFDRMAGDYIKRNSSSNVFLHYFNTQRLESSLKNLEAEGTKEILDIGAGTGFLYHALKQKGLSTESYLGVDLSGAMLKASIIPEHQRVEGDFLNIHTKIEGSFDYVFCLGLTTYLSSPQLLDLLNLVGKKLKKDGRLLISFTHSTSLDFLIRSFLKKILPSSYLRNRSLGFSAPLSFSKKTAVALLKEQGYSVKSLVYLNQTVFPFNTIFPRLSLKIAPLILRLPKYFSAFLSSDFLIEAALGGENEV